MAECIVLIFLGFIYPRFFCANMAQKKSILGTILEYEKKDLPDIAGNLLEQSFEYTI